MGEMMLFNNLELFSNANFSLAYFKHNDEYFFKAIDIAKCLGYKNTRKAVRDHVKDKYKFCFESTGTNRSGGVPAIFISLSGLFQFLAQSKMADAEPFQDWVFEQVLPSIAKTGEYKLGPEQQVEAILNGVNKTNKPVMRKMFLEASEKCKDQDKSDNGKKGGNALWVKIRETERENVQLKKENTLLRQTVIEDYFPYAS